MELSEFFDSPIRRWVVLFGALVVLAMVAAPAAQASGSITSAAGVQFSGVVDSASCTPTSTTPTINWGDGQTSTGTYDATSNNVTGTHTYAAASPSGSPYNGTVALDCATTPDTFTATVSPAPQFTQCPRVNVDFGCQFLITISSGGTTILQDTNQGPYEGSEDALIGVQNNSSRPVSSFPLATPGSGLFSFEGDGICDPGGLPIPSGCVPAAGAPAGTTCNGSGTCAFPAPAGQPAGYTEPGALSGTTQNGYEGPTSWFSSVSTDFTSGQVNFSPALAPGQSTYFSLEEPPSLGALAVGATPSGVGFSRPPTVTNTGAGFSGLVNPNGSVTTANFQYGLDSRYYTPGTSGPVYSQSTPPQGAGGDFSAHTVLASVRGLVPHALYHVRLVATNKDGTTFGPDVTFQTKQDALPPPPVLGKDVNVVPLSGIVYIRPPSGKAFTAAAVAAPSNPLLKGKGFAPLTEARQIPIGSTIDARAGTLRLVAATGARGKAPKTQSGIFGGGLFNATQGRSRISKGLTTLTLLANAFPGAPSYSQCKIGKALAGPRTAKAASGQPGILQTLHASDNHGKFRTKGRYSAGTVRGTVWDTTEECAGTLTVVHRGTVAVFDSGRRKTITVHAGHSYLARARHK
jgi:hypothetical protein